MTTLKDRLFKIAFHRDERATPDNRYFEELLGLSSGRISQLFKPGSLERIGSKSLIRLEKMGYSGEWVLEGKGEMLLSETSTQCRLTPEDVRLLDDLAALLPEDAAVWRAQISAAAIKERRKTEPDSHAVPKKRRAGSQ
jgi:hypothetical protein